MGKTGKIVLIVVLLVAAGVIFYLRSGNVNDLTAQREYNTLLECLECQHRFQAALDVADRAPFECPSCHKKAAWFVWECAKCGARFVPPPEGDPPRQPVAPVCSKCGSGNVGRASLEQEL